MSRLLFYPQSFGLNNIIIKDLMLKTNCNTIVVSDDRYIEDTMVQWFAFKWSNMTNEYRGRAIVRIFESIYCYIRLLIMALLGNVRMTVVFNVVNWLPWEYLVIRLLSGAGVNVEFVLHDWNDEQWKNGAYRYAMSRATVASLLSRHKVYSLSREFKLNNESTLIKFPKISFSEDCVQRLSIKDIDFCFFGTYREDKSIESLLSYPWLRGRLIIGGSGYPKEVIDRFQVAGWTVLDGFVSNHDLFTFLQRSKFLLLPYVGGSASAWPQIAGFFGCIPLMSESQAFIDYRKVIPSEYYLENIIRSEKCPKFSETDYFKNYD